MPPIAASWRVWRFDIPVAPGGEGRLAPDLTTLGAIDDCNKGNFAAGIAALEKKLRNNGFTLPKR